jgi:hypothetical protein
MTSNKLPENKPNITSNNDLNASLGYIAVFQSSEFSLHTDEANKTLVAKIPVLPEQAESYLKGKEIHVSVEYIVDPNLAVKNANLFKQKE